MKYSLSKIEISRENIAYNLKNVKALLKSQTRLMIVVKSNAYGHGLVEFAKEAVKCGADYLGVVNIDEALELRRAHIIKPILVLGYVPKEALADAAKNYIDISIISPEQVVEILNSKYEGKLKIHIKAETGINRLGINAKNILNICKELSRIKKVELVGIYSHLASVEENNLDYTAEQFRNFGTIIKTLEKYNIKIPIKHIAASGATFLFPESHFNMVRVGIASYGLWPSEENRKNFLAEADIDIPKPFLKPVLSYKTQIVQVKEISGGYVGYGCTYRVTKAMKIAVIPVGYFEGLDRGLSCSSKKTTKTERSGCGEVLISGVRCPIIGRVCMNMSIVDISKLKSQITNGEEVVIIGKQGKEEITVDEIAKKIDTINYEIVSRIPEHIPRIYI